jgi:hypothetical protein
MTHRDNFSSDHAELRGHLAALLAGARLWSTQAVFDESALDRVRREAIELNHRRYVASIPAYGLLARESTSGDMADFETIVDQMLLTADVFKSYDPRWLADSDFARMTQWLDSIFFRRLDMDLAGVDSVSRWRERLRGDGVYLMYSSGTSGRLSFVPRDRSTLAALQFNGPAYSHTPWDRAGASDRPFDCLVLVPRGVALGLQAGATGLARAAERSHFLFDVELTAERIRPTSESDRRTGAGGDGKEPTAAVYDRDEAYARALEFLREVKAGGRRFLVFGPPFEVEELCARLLATKMPIRLPDDSLVITAGGWKSVASIRRQDVVAHVQDALGVPADHVIDTYSTAECNCVLMTCPHGRYHVPPIIEVVVLDDLLMRMAGDDVFGSIAFLDPFALSYPGHVITGDIGRLIHGPCPCGLTGWAIVGEIRRAPAQDTAGCAGVMARAMA